MGPGHLKITVLDAVAQDPNQRRESDHGHAQNPRNPGKLRMLNKMCLL